MSIPKKIFQTAKSFETLPVEIRESIEQLRARNPEWSYTFFDDAAMKVYLRDHLNADDWQIVEDVNPKYGVVLADLFRYVLLYNEGGVYLDIKSTAWRPLSEVIEPGTEFVISQWENKIGQDHVGMGFYPELAYIPGGEFQQWCIIAAPRHPFLKAAIKQVLYNLKTYTPLTFGTDAWGVIRLSGPIAYTKAIYPLLDHYPHTAIDLTMWDIQYSIYGKAGDKLFRHQDTIKDYNHYSRVGEPIVRKDVFVEPEVTVVTKLGELLARELRENTDLVLKLAVFSVMSTATVFVILVSIALFAVLR